jgi:hypothetical protein
MVPIIGSAMQMMRAVAEAASGYLHFRHRHQEGLEVVDAVLAGTVFVLLFFNGEASHFVGLLSHLIVAFLFLTKLFSLVALKERRKRPSNVRI